LFALSVPDMLNFKRSVAIKKCPHYCSTVLCSIEVLLLPFVGTMA